VPNRTPSRTRAPRRDSSAVGGPGSRLQVTTQFDARVHDGTQRGAHGPKSYVDQSAPEKRGPLLELFLAYARRDDHRRRDAPLSFSKNDADESLGAGSLLSRAEVFGMMRDFAVVPSLVTERDARLAFAHADAPRGGRRGGDEQRERARFSRVLSLLSQRGDAPERVFGTTGVLRCPPRPGGGGTGKRRRGASAAAAPRVRLAGHASTEGEGGRSVPSIGPQPESGGPGGGRARTEGAGPGPGPVREPKIRARLLRHAFGGSARDGGVHERRVAGQSDSRNTSEYVGRRTRSRSSVSRRRLRF
jgi:hypothetical protein